MKAAIVVAALALGGCYANLGVTQAQVDTARSTYTGALIAELAYARLPVCAAGKHWTLQDQCHEIAKVRVMKSVDKIINSDFNQLQAQIDAGTNTGVVALLADLKLEIDNFAALAAAR